jgi:hypothetical protein
MRWERNREIVGLTSALFVATIVACAKTPSDPTIPDALCSPRCQRDHDCDPHVDVTDCVTKCEHLLSPRAVYWREDYVRQVRDCAQRQACAKDTDRAIAECVRDARRRLPPTPAAVDYCKVAVPNQTNCGIVDRSLAADYDHCIQNHDLYSDAALHKLTDCEQEPCRTHAACYYDAVGEGSALDNERAVRQLNNVRLQDAGSPTITVQGHVHNESDGMMAGVSVCLRDSQVPCSTSDATGAFAIDVPAHAEIALSFMADGYEARLVALATVGRNPDDLGSITMPSAATEAARYAKAGVTGPDASTGTISVLARTPEGTRKGLEGVTVAIDPPSGHGAVYLAPEGAPDTSLTATSTNGSALIAGVSPGVVELTMGPTDVSCAPSFGGWPSNRPNSVRLPVIAGFATRLAMRCHK